MQTLIVNDESAGGRCAIVRLIGQATIADRSWFRCLLEIQAAEQPVRLVADLSQLTSLDWWATLLLVWVERVIARRGGLLLLSRPQPAVAEALRAAGAEHVLSAGKEPATGRTARTAATAARPA